jgi:hypothetical protein
LLKNFDLSIDDDEALPPITEYSVILATVNPLSLSSKYSALSNSEKLVFDSKFPLPPQSFITVGFQSLP